ncbi:MAG TPA: Ku protein [Rhizobiaceae bacterium]|nr:Ku protein [Rhizobiaceae bacterium]
MAPRPAWRGYLKLSLVTCAVELTGATTESEKVRFRILNQKTGNTVKRQYIDSTSGKPVAEDDQVRGHETGSDEFLLFEEDEIDAVQIESSHTLDLDGFVSKKDVPALYLDTPYYVTPADDVSEEAFAVIRDAMAERKMAGLTRIVLYRREHPALIEPYEKGMLLTTLRYDKTVRGENEIFEGLGKTSVDPDMIEMAEGIVDRKTMKFDPSTFDDRYEEALLDMITKRRKGKKADIAKPAETPSNVVNLFDALKKSLASEKQESDNKPQKPASRAKSSSTKSASKKTSPRSSSSSRKSPSGKKRKSA